MKKLTKKELTSTIAGYWVCWVIRQAPYKPFLYCVWR